MSRLTRDGTAELVSRDQFPRHARGQGNIIFPVQLTTSRIGNLTRLIHTLLHVMTIHTYILTSSRNCSNRCDVRNSHCVLSLCDCLLEQIVHTTVSNRIPGVFVKRQKIWSRFQEMQRSNVLEPCSPDHDASRSCNRTRLTSAEYIQPVSIYVPIVGVGEHKNWSIDISG